MAQIFPFAAYRYDASRFPLEKVLTQPYDKITPAMQERYSRLNPCNLITVEKGRATPHDTPQDNVYTRAAVALDQWIAQNVLIRDPKPAVYVYSQEYDVPHSQERKLRRGFIALGRVEDYSAGVVFRHEQTLAAPRADRLELLRHTRAHTGQLFMLYDDEARCTDALLDEAAHGPAPVEVNDEYSVVHRLWPVSDETLIQRLAAEMLDKRLVIADGHHRYETALAFRDERRAALGAVHPDAPHEKVMMTFINTYSAGLTILPTHRVITNLRGFRFDTFRAQLEPWFDCTAFPFHTDAQRESSYRQFRRALARGRREFGLLGVYAMGPPRAFHLFSLRRAADLSAALPDVSPAQRQLDVVLLHRLMLEKGLSITADAVSREQNLRYEREMDAAIAAVDNAQARLCCLLNPVRVEQVMQIALAGEVLPQKSTDFYPKLLSGLTIYRLDE